MEERRTNLIQVRMNNKEKEMLINKVKEINSKSDEKNINVSDLIRVCIKNSISVHEKIKEGNLMCLIPSPKEITDNKISMVEIETLLNDKKLSNYTRKILTELSNYLEMDYFSKKYKYKNSNTFFENK